MPTIDAAARHDLTNAQWRVLEPLLPPPPRRGRPRRCPVRALLDGVRYRTRTRTGCPWRDAADRYGPWWRIYALFCCWQVREVWARIESSLLQAGDAAGKIETGRSRSTPPSPEPTSTPPGPAATA